MNRVLQHQEVIGSYVVFDPTGRDLPEAFEVGRIVDVRWDDADDGNDNGFPRPLMTVRPNGDEELIAVTRVAAVLPRPLGVVGATGASGPKL